MANFGLGLFPWESLDSHGMAKQTKAIYEKIKDRLEAEHVGEVVAIDVESGGYFLGKTGFEAACRVKARCPDRIPYINVIGRRAYISFRRLEPNLRLGFERGEPVKCHTFLRLLTKHV